MRTKKQKLGDNGELLAEKFLQEKGYIVLQKNFRVPSGEIDIITTDDDMLVFIEVKTRRSEKYGSAVEGVDAKKIQRMYKAIEAYFYEHEKDIDAEPFRIDIIAITICSGKLEKIEHLQNAVEAGDI